jgi:hypothetical protein
MSTTLTNNNNNNTIFVGGSTIQPSATLSVAQDLSTGSVPNNETIVNSLKEFELPLKMQSEEKSGVEGRLAYNTSQLVRHAREMFEEKNSEDFIKHIHAHIVEAGEFLAKSVQQNPAQAAATAVQVVGTAQAMAQVQVNQLKQLVDSLRRLCIALAKKPTFRVKAIEAIQLAQELATKYTQAALGKAEEKLEKAQSGVESFGKQTDSSASDKLKKDGPSEEQKRATKEKIRSLLVELGKTPEYKETIQNLFAFFQTNWSFLSSMLSNNEVDRKALTSLIVLSSDVQGLIEKFSGDVSLTPLTTTIAGLLYAIPNDQDFIDYFTELKTLITSTLTSPESQDINQIDQNMKKLKEKASNLFKKEKIQKDAAFVFKETKELIERIQKDDSLATIGEDVDRLRKEVLLNNSGKLDLQTLRNAVPALKNVLIPTLTQAFSSIPIPPINMNNEKYDTSLTNINIAAADLIPEKIRIHFTNDILFDFSPAARDLFVSSLYVKLQDFGAFIRDMNFRYDRKKMPAITDVGIVDVEIIGTTIEIRWRMDMIGQKLCFYVDDCRCIMKNFKTTIKESRHMVINKIAMSFMNNSIKRNIEETVENIIRTKLVEFSIDTSLPLSEQLPLAF